MTRRSPDTEAGAGKWGFGPSGMTSRMLSSVSISDKQQVIVCVCVWDVLTLKTPLIVRWPFKREPGMGCTHPESRPGHLFSVWNPAVAVGLGFGFAKSATCPLQPGVAGGRLLAGPPCAPAAGLGVMVPSDCAHSAGQQWGMGVGGREAGRLTCISKPLPHPSEARHFART